MGHFGGQRYAEVQRDEKSSPVIASLAYLASTSDAGISPVGLRIKGVQDRPARILNPSRVFRHHVQC
jgi:hypothetical protein